MSTSLALSFLRGRYNLSISLDSSIFPFFDFGRVFFKLFLFLDTGLWEHLSKENMGV